VDDVRALHLHRLRGGVRQAGLGAVVEKRDCDEPQGDRGEGEPEQGGGEQQPVPADLDRPLRVAVQMDDLGAPRRSRIGAARVAGRGSGDKGGHGAFPELAKTAPSAVSPTTGRPSGCSAPGPGATRGGATGGSGNGSGSASKRLSRSAETGSMPR